MFSKSAVSQSFSLAAKSYDGVADLQRQMGGQLLAKIPDGEYSTILDLGCGTGHFGSRLKERYAPDLLIGMDLAEGMLAVARQGEGAPASGWCCADAEYLPLQGNSCSLIFSNLVLQWCNDLPRVFAEAHRVLAADGCFVFSSLGPATLCELKEAWQQVDDYVHVNQFVDKQQIAEAATDAGFECYNYDEKIVVGYSQVKDLTRTLKSLGANNINQARPKGLTGRHNLQKMLDYYEHFRDEQGVLPATYEAYYFLLRKMK